MYDGQSVSKVGGHWEILYEKHQIISVIEERDGEIDF